MSTIDLFADRYRSINNISKEKPDEEKAFFDYHIFVYLFLYFVLSYASLIYILRSIFSLYSVSTSYSQLLGSMYMCAVGLVKRG